MTVIDDENPCGGVGVAFDPEMITATQREWLTKQIVNGTMTAAQVARRYKLKRVTLGNWAFRHRKGHTARSVQGRPRALDKEALLGLQTWLKQRDPVTNNSDDLSDVKEKLKEAYRETRKRRRCNEDANEDGRDIKMCRGTMLNYLNCVKLNNIDELVSML